MSASFTSKCSIVGRSLLGSLSNNLLGAAKTNHEVMSRLHYNSIFSQQQRTFIQMRINLKLVDNFGAKRVMCIQALKVRRGARLGDTIIASVKEAQPRGKVKKGEVVYGVVVRDAMQRGCCDGSEIKFNDNAVVLVNKQGEPICTHVLGLVPHELRKKKHLEDFNLGQTYSLSLWFHRLHQFSSISTLDVVSAYVVHTESVKGDNIYLAWLFCMLHFAC